MTQAAKRAEGQMRYHGGLAAEATVIRAYERAGANVVETRWRGQHGEIDLIVEAPDGFVFVEVKSARSFEEAAQRLGPRQVGRICNSALEYVAQTPRGLASSMRFDLAVVDGIGRCEILENAFGGA